jgi:hypothetical protein
MSGDFQIVFDEVVREHQLKSSLDLSVARTIARILVDDGGDPIRAAESVAKLRALLPSNPGAYPDAPADLSRLSDEEIGVMHLLCCRAKGVEPDAPIDLERLAPAQLARHREIEAQRERLFEEQRAREERLERENERLWAQNHRLLTENWELARRGPEKPVGGDGEGAGSGGAVERPLGVPGQSPANVLVLPGIKR